MLTTRNQRAGTVLLATAVFTVAWGEGPLPLPARLKNSRECWHGFYAPELNAHFFYIAHDSHDRGTLWVYRYKKAAEKK